MILEKTGDHRARRPVFSKIIAGWAAACRVSVDGARCTSARVATIGGMRSRGLPPELVARPFSVSEADAAGVPRWRLGTRAVPPVFRGVYSSAGSDLSLAARAAGLAQVMPPDARFSHWTAAHLYGAPVREDVAIHVTVPATRHVPRRRDGVVTHQRVRTDDAPRLVAEVLLSSPEQTFVDLAASLSLDDLVILGDYFLRHWTSREAIERHVAASPRATRGIVRAREALPLLREGVDSPAETRLRLIVVRDGLPEPAVNPTVFDTAGEWLGRPDLAHLREKIATQVDGDVHRTNRRRWRQDIARDEAFRDDGWVVLRTTGQDLAYPGPYLARLRRALRRHRPGQ